MLKEFKELQSRKDLKISLAEELFEAGITTATEEFVNGFEELSKKSSDSDFMEFINEKSIDMDEKVIAIAMRSGKLKAAGTIISKEK